MDTNYLQLTCQEAAGLIRIHRPEKHNALSPDVLTEIRDVFTTVSKDETIAVVVLTGGEKMFSAGFDLDFIRTIEQTHNQDFIRLFHQAYRAILFCRQPVIAAVGGPAIAGGFDLTMMCDIRYASKRARFGQREVVLALPPLLDPLWRIIGIGRAKEVSLTGRIYDAEEALSMGYVSRVFPEGELLKSVMAIARKMAACDRETLLATKQLYQTIGNLDLDGSMQVQEWLFRSFIGSNENHRRIDNLLDQIRKP